MINGPQNKRLCWATILIDGSSYSIQFEIKIHELLALSKSNDNFKRNKPYQKYLEPMSNFYSMTRYISSRRKQEISSEFGSYLNKIFANGP